MTATAMVSLKGRIHDYGPALDLPAAMGVVYVGRRCTMGGWRLQCSPFHNPFTAQQHGGAAAAVDEFRRYLLNHPGLMRRARRELAGKRLGCFCRQTQDPRACHAALWCAICDADLADLAGLLGAPKGRPVLAWGVVIGGGA